MYGWIFACDMADFSDNSDVEIISQIPEAELLNTACDQEECFGNVLEEICVEQQEQDYHDQESLLTDMWVYFCMGILRSIFQFGIGDFLELRNLILFQPWSGWLQIHASYCYIHAEIGCTIVTRWVKQFWWFLL